MISVCRRRSVSSKCAPKGSVNSVHSVRERNILQERKNSPANLIDIFSSRGCILFSQKNTEEQNTQHSTETLSQPISQNVTPNRGLTPAPLRMERGVITEIHLHVLQMFSIHSPSISRLIEVTSHTTPPLHSERGWE